MVSWTQDYEGNERADHLAKQAFLRHLQTQCTPLMNYGLLK